MRRTKRHEWHVYVRTLGGWTFGRISATTAEIAADLFVQGDQLPQGLEPGDKVTVYPAISAVAFVAEVPGSVTLKRA